MRGTCGRCNLKFNKKFNEQIICNRCIKSDERERKKIDKKPAVHIYKDLAGYFYFACRIDKKVKIHVKTIFNNDNKKEKFEEFKLKYCMLFGDYDNKPLKFRKALYEIYELDGVKFE